MHGPSTPSHDAPVGQPGSRRVGNLSAAMRQSMAVGPLTRGEVAGIVAAVLVVAGVCLMGALVGLDWLLQAVLAVGLGTFVGTEVAKRAIPTPIRRALEAFGYLGEWEIDRSGAVDAGPMGSADEAARWLAAHPERPEDRWLRWELLLLLDRPAEAAAVAARIPDTTPYEAFERAYAIDRVAWRRAQPATCRRCGPWPRRSARRTARTGATPRSRSPWPRARISRPPGPIRCRRWRPSATACQPTWGSGGATSPGCARSRSSRRSWPRSSCRP